MLIEKWLPVVGFEQFYEVSDRGRVRSLDRVITKLSRWGKEVQNRCAGRMLRLTVRPDGHRFVTLTDGVRLERWFVHELVLTAFVGPKPDGLECRHMDGVPDQNQLGNLKWGTRLENMADRKRLGEENPPRGTRCHRAKFTERDVRFIRREVRLGRSFAQIARDLSASRGAVGKVAMGYTWKWLA